MSGPGDQYKDRLAALDVEGHVSHYPPGSLSAYTHGNCRCAPCKARNTEQRQLQRAGLTAGRKRRTLEDRVREAMGAR
jgi:hypothetical protein